MPFTREKQIVFVRKNKPLCQMYEGEKLTDITDKQRFIMLAQPKRFKFQVAVHYEGKLEDMEQDYKKYVEDAREVVKITDGKINPFKTGSYGNTSIALFKSIFGDEVPDRIEDYEQKFLTSCGGGIRLATPVEDKVILKYDINSFYPCLMQSKILKIPFEAGTLISKKEVEEILQGKATKFGVYNVKIEVKDERLFTEMKSNRYSCYEVGWAKQLGLRITVLGSALVWEREQLRYAKDVFGEYVDYLYQFKQKNKMFKWYLNTLWGKLCQANQVQKKVCTMEELEKYQDADKLEVLDDEKDLYIMHRKKKSFRFKTSFARLKPFILGLGRIKMHTYVKKLGKQNVVFAHTDSIFSLRSMPWGSKCLRGKIDSHEIGRFKFEGKFTASVFDKNNYELKQKHT